MHSFVSGSKVLSYPKLLVYFSSVSCVLLTKHHHLLKKSHLFPCLSLDLVMLDSVPFTYY